MVSEGGSVARVARGSTAGSGDGGSVGVWEVEGAAPQIGQANGASAGSVALLSASSHSCPCGQVNCVGMVGPWTCDREKPTANPAARTRYWNKALLHPHYRRSWNFF